MEKNFKSKITVIGFVAFVLAIYTGSYFYTKNNNERLLSAPRLVLLVGLEEQVNSDFERMTIEKRRAEIGSMFSLGRVLSLSQAQYDSGITDIAGFYTDHNIGDEYVIADCMEYSERLKETMELQAKSKMKASWIFSACGIIEEN